MCICIKLAVWIVVNNMLIDICIFVESIDDEDEVVLVYAEQLGELIDCVGGHQYCYKILQTLGGLCVAEETSVREMVSVLWYCTCGAQENWMLVFIFNILIFTPFCIDLSLHCQSN